MADTGIIPHLPEYPSRQQDTSPPLLSILTTVRNGERTLARTIESVRAQNFPSLEYIIADAGSTDGTIDIIKANLDVVTYWQSEKDRGISDGFNKAIALSRGKYVTILNADDWLSPGQLAFGVETLEKSGADFVFGDLLYHDVNGRVLHRISGEADYARRIGRVMPALNHPTVIVRRHAYAKHGLFDTSLRLAMDYDLLLRLHRAGCRGIYDPRITGHMTLEGASDTHSRRALAEVRDISIRHGQPPLAAWLRFAFRIVKGEARRISQNLLPAPLHARLRGAVNRNYSGPSR
ncbi:MAG TPA: glycosyltransferase family 2 protein [Rhizomicrobium sp.]|nr:glycosyltransferase family 2 protein [Rhizomicrobium sp.]